MLYKLFGVLALIFGILFAVLYAIILTYPIIGGLFLAIPMMIAGWGLGIFIILFIVFIAIRR